MKFFVSLLLIVLSNIQIGNFRIIKKVWIHTPQNPLGPDSLYPKGGLFCYFCHPGFHLDRDCTSNFTTATCSKCPPGTYNSNYNIATKCAICTTYCLDRYAEIVRHCNATSDSECRCIDGYYNHSTGPGEWKCLPHTTCEPGREPYQRGNSTHDTICHKCSNGYYSSLESSTSKCKPCSQCGPDHTVLSSCNATHNTACVFSKEKLSSDRYDLQLVIPLVFFSLLMMLVVLFLCRKGLPLIVTVAKKETMRTEEDGEQLVSWTTEEVDAAWGELIRKLTIIIPPRKWKAVTRHLLSKSCRMSQSEINNRIEAKIHDNQNNVKEQMYNSLQMWYQCAAQTACLEDVISALKSNKISANNLERKFDMLLRKNIFPKI